MLYFFKQLQPPARKKIKLEKKADSAGEEVLESGSGTVGEASGDKASVVENAGGKGSEPDDDNHNQQN